MSSNDYYPMGVNGSHPYLNQPDDDEQYGSDWEDLDDEYVEVSVGKWIRKTLWKEDEDA